MRALAALACATACVTAAAAPAAAGPPGDGEMLCGMTVVTDPDPRAPEHSYVAVLDGGPISGNGTMTCTIQVGGAGLHTDPDNGAKASATGTNGVTVFVPTLVSYTAPPGTNVYLCDQFTDSSNVTYVYDDMDGAWEAAAGNPSAACRLTLSGEPEDPFAQGVLEAVEGVLCPVVAILGPGPVVMGCP